MCGAFGPIYHTIRYAVLHHTPIHRYYITGNHHLSTTGKGNAIYRELQLISLDARTNRNDQDDVKSFPYILLLPSL